MKLEEQVVSLELAKKLKELGVKQESLWEWVYDVRDDESVSFVFRKGEGIDLERVCSAFTVAELGEMLPFRVESHKQIGLPSLGWRCIFNSRPIGKVVTFEDITEANARAEMLIYLKEKGLLQNGK